MRHPSSGSLDTTHTALFRFVVIIVHIIMHQLIPCDSSVLLIETELAKERQRIWAKMSTMELRTDNVIARCLLELFQALNRPISEEVHLYHLLREVQLSKTPILNYRTWGMLLNDLVYLAPYMTYQEYEWTCFLSSLCLLFYIIPNSDTVQYLSTHSSIMTNKVNQIHNTKTHQSIVQNAEEDTTIANESPCGIYNYTPTNTATAGAPSIFHMSYVWIKYFTLYLSHIIL